MSSEAEQETEVQSRRRLLKEAMQPVVVTRFLDDIGKSAEAGKRFTKMLKVEPRHPVLKCVLEREPFHRGEVMSLGRLFLRCCAGCGKSQEDVNLTRCTECKFAHFCSEKCARRAGKHHHTAMCPRLRELHDALMPSLIKADERAKRAAVENTPAFQTRKLLELFFRIGGYLLAVFAVIWIVLVAYQLIMLASGAAVQAVDDFAPPEDHLLDEL